MAPRTKVETKVALLTAKNEAIFARLNQLYNIFLNLPSTDSLAKKDFMAQTETIDEMRFEFSSILDQINTLQLEDNVEFIPNYQPLMAFDDLHTRIKRARNDIVSTNHTFINENALKREVLKLKLPPIEIPSFDGKTQNWPVFYESFKSNIHNNSQLTDSQRVQYLVGKLCGNALKITAGIVPTGDTYNIMWDTLVNKYQDVRVLGTHYLNNIFELKCSNNTANQLESFIEIYSASIAALNKLEIPNLTDFILFNCALRRLDTATLQSFELSVRDKKVPTSLDLISFVRDQVKILVRYNSSFSTNIRSTKNVTAYNSQTRDRPDKIYKTFVARNDESKSTPGEKKCTYCNGCEHPLYKCTYFKSLESPKLRYDLIKSKRGCVNCCSLSHTISSCNSTSVCVLCNRRHHTLLHFENKETTTLTATTRNHNEYLLSPRATADLHPLSRSHPPIREHQTNAGTMFPVASNGSNRCPTMSQNDSSIALNGLLQPSSSILLATAQVYAIKGNSKVKYPKTVIRCLIDNGSQNNLITLDTCKLLDLPIIPLRNSIVKGIGLSSRPIYGYANLEIQSRYDSNNKYSINVLVVDCLTDELPSQLINNYELSYLENIPMADLTWNVPGKIDLILGAQLFPYIYLGNKIESGSLAPPALLTAFGYVLMGDIPYTYMGSSFTGIAINEIMQKFWELEELPKVKYLSPNETACENIFITSVRRDANNRYCVSLPFCKDPSELGNSLTIARRRFLALERKLNNDSMLRVNYSKVIDDYIRCGYLSEISESEITPDGYYIPHHSITRPDKPMPRIVLDASAKTHSGLSLNDVLYTGPNLQADLFLLLLDFRLFPIAMIADIKQMYLQIKVADEDKKYLRILFRSNEHEPLRTFNFNRVPFGLKPSPYLAMRTLRLLAEDMALYYPEAAKVAETRLYTDDLVHSAPDNESAINLAKDLISLFKSGCFDLIKWNSNSPVLLRNLPSSCVNTVQLSDTTKVLGMLWEPTSDSLQITTCAINEKCTKRNILSVVARLFDVLGLVAPVILYAKLCIKELWLCNIDWDESPPDSVTRRFYALAKEIPLLSNLKIPRHIGVFKNCISNIVAFCDASMHGYGCVVYLHTIDSANNVTVRLLCAKSKVSPTKVTTLARLELCAAVLMSKLIKTVSDTYLERIPIANTYAFSDSMIALSWIHSSPHRWSVFVSNRVAICQENLSANYFYHVAGNENPSDCLSRGMLPSQLVAHDLWWNGPSWLLTAPSQWPIKVFKAPANDELPEYKANILVTQTTHNDSSVVYELTQRISSWNKLLRIITYILRFVKRVSLTDHVQSIISAERSVIKVLQNMHFHEDIRQLQAGRLPSKRLQRLCVFLDSNHILRVGGRLSKSDLPFEVKHPALLPKRDHVVNIIIAHYHEINCHTGPGLLVSIIRQRFWIMDARTVVRAITRKCNACFRLHPSSTTPLMADLPRYRISEAKAFVHTGVDYAGPIRITLSRRRGQHAQKAYICIFVCLVVKAIHIELVTDLTTDTFLAAFKRFISRRGPVSCLYSDNGTNFIGAKAQLDELYQFLMRTDFQNSLKNELVNRRINWKTIPPRAPHFGSMWESNIKSLKSNLFKTIGNQLLTYEELQTVLVQIECIMNSRPLNVVSSDPYPDIITPAHFLMSTPLQYLPARDLTEEKLCLKQRKDLLDKMVQSYWKKWRLEYLHTLQARQKWATPAKPVTIGTVVIVQQDDCPPLTWPLGIITEVYPGTDNIVRVASVKTKAGVFKRPVVKLCPIPTQ